jgi:Skp family chaperone for outer membrane proteins
MRDGRDRSTNSNREKRKVKRTFAVMAGFAALGLMVYVGSHLSAQAPVAAAAPAQTRVAVINLLQVIKNYNKAKFYETELEGTLKPYRDKAEKLKGDMIQWQNYLSDPKNGPTITQEQRETGEKSVTNIKRQLEDLDKEARKAFGKKRELQVVQLYKEVDEAVKRYAAANGFHLVLSFGEPVNATDLFSAPNIARKLEGIQMGGACMPMYFADGMDISGPVVEGLNRAYPGGAATAATPGGG